MDAVGEAIAALGGMGEISAGAVVMLIVVLIIKGQLVPNRTLLFLVSERDEWKVTAMKSMETASQNAVALEHLVELGKTLKHLLNSLPSTAASLDELREAEQQGREAQQCEVEGGHNV